MRHIIYWASMLWALHILYGCSEVVQAETSNNNPTEGAKVVINHSNGVESATTIKTYDEEGRVSRIDSYSSTGEAVSFQEFKYSGDTVRVYLWLLH